MLNALHSARHKTDLKKKCDLLLSKLPSGSASKYIREMLAHSRSSLNACAASTWRLHFLI